MDFLCLFIFENNVKIALFKLYILSCFMCAIISISEQEKSSNSIVSRIFYGILNPRECFINSLNCVYFIHHVRIFSFDSFFFLLQILFNEHFFLEALRFSALTFNFLE